jgi:DNA invertase Pin-like site-specific DNA recombinase
VLRDERVSGTEDAADRPGLTAALTMIEDRGAEGLLVARLDRLARTLAVQEAVLGHVWKHGGRVYAADVREVLQDDPDDPMRTAMRQMMGCSLNSSAG